MVSGNLGSSKAQKREEGGGRGAGHFAAAAAVGSEVGRDNEGSEMNPIQVEGTGNTYHNCTFNYSSMNSPPTPRTLYTPHTHPTATFPTHEPVYGNNAYTYQRHVHNTHQCPRYDMIPDAILATIHFPGIAPPTNENPPKRRAPPKNPYKRKTCD